ncbi:fanconi-associated nuclease 1-like isoform X2 [Zootermopsis nevadensis]|uniref:fanconi-associated nuclease 1-like isoform X2 n=1 Tax=Zootermopsis nevadensis TaxID=136037 RepID=UPI000B8EDACE|nr:fanconi-associated nuclease 1-like isoform X2 [Zootermopsis nevadensis]
MTSFQTPSSSYAGSQENEKDIIIIDEIKNQNLSVDGIQRGNISVFQDGESTVDNTIKVISQISTPPRISLSDAQRIKNEVRMLQLKRDKKRCAKSNEYSCTRDSVTRVLNLSMPTTTSGMVSGLSTVSPKVPIERKSIKIVPLSRKQSDVGDQPALSSDHKILLPRSKTSQNKIPNKARMPPRIDSNVIRQCGLPLEHTLVSPSKMSIGKTNVRKDNELIKASENNGSHMKKGNDSPLHLREESVECCFSKRSGVPLTSVSDKQVSVLSENMHSSVDGGKATDHKAPPSSGTELELDVNKLHYYVSLLFSDTERKQNDACSLSSDKGKKTKLVSKNKNVLVHNPDVVSEIRQSSSAGNSVACKESLSTTHAHEQEQSVHISVCSRVESKGKGTCGSPDFKEKETSDHTARSNNVSDVHKSRVSGSLCGGSVTSSGSTATVHAQSPTFLSNSLGNKCMKRAKTIGELQITHPQSQSVKLSHELSQHPSKFCVVKRNSFEILMSAQKSLPKKSPTKRLCNSSPIKYMKKNRSLCNLRYRAVSPNKPKACKSLKFDNCSTEAKSRCVAATDPENQGSVSEFYSNEYVGYFESIVAEVLKDRDLLTLLSEEEVMTVTNFWKLENQVKELYVRMLSRKYTWHRVSDIKYDHINVPAAFIELEVSGFVTSDYSSEQLEVLLNLLKVPELRSLCRTFRISSATRPKPEMIQALLQYGRTQHTISGIQGSDSASLIKSRLREALGHCIKLCTRDREGFFRIMLLFSLPHQYDEEDRQCSKQLLLMNCVKTRTVEFPTYIIHKTIPIFTARNDLIRFQEAGELLTGLMKAVADKSWDEALDYGQQAREHFKTVIEDSAQKYTAGSTYAYAMTKAIGAFKKHKDHMPNGVIILQELLSQHIYLPQYRGKWYEQLALLLQVHLKNCEQAAKVVIKAMKDNHLSEVDQHMLSCRGTVLMLSKGLGKDLKQKLNENIKKPLEIPPNVTIKAKSMQGNGPGRKRVYVQEDVYKQETTYSSIEEYAIFYYKSKGYTEGIHDEGSVINSLFGLIFWDVIYEHPVPDVFRTSYQQVPLDLYSEEFYRNRKEAVDEKLESLCHCDMKFVSEYVERMLKEHEGKESIVNWQRFQNLEQIVKLINCIGMQVLSKILERLVKSYRVRSGFPDLLVWNPITSKYKFVEVKGPGDRLSVAQNMWLNYLTKCNANAEVCYIETTGATAVKRKMKNVPTDEDAWFTC